MDWLIRWRARQRTQGLWVAQRLSGHRHHFLLGFFFFFLNVCFPLLLFWGHPCYLAPPVCVCPVPRGSIWNPVWTNSRGRNLMGQVMGGKCVCVYACVCVCVCVCVHLSTQWFVYMYLFSIKSVHKWVCTPAHNLDSCVCTFCVFVCAELGKECAFDWVQIVHKSGL